LFKNPIIYFINQEISAERERSIAIPKAPDHFAQNHKINNFSYATKRMEAMGTAGTTSRASLLAIAWAPETVWHKKLQAGKTI
jgi:hypothetical protein